MSAQKQTVTAAVAIIGNEILSGRTKDANLPFLAEQLNALGIQVREARVVADVTDEIVAAVNELRSRYDYVFTTGGIGPTHDDITAEAVAKAFDVAIDVDAEARALLERHYATTGAELNEARLRMARLPHGATMVENPISKAPGFQIGNVFVLAGIPVVAQAMFESLKHRLVGGAPVQSRAIAVFLAEGTVAKGLGALQDKYPSADIGSYPFHRQGRFGTSLVVRSQDAGVLNAATEELRALLAGLGGEMVEEVNDPG
jgi:molybdenum cofactor synthesis domain-containing protein